MSIPARASEELSQAIYKALKRLHNKADAASVDSAAREVFARYFDRYLAETAELDAAIDRLHTDLDAARAELAATRTADHIASALPDCPRCGAAHWPDCDAGGLHTDTP
jgi:arylsulfatase A-like enzyme